MRFSFGRSFSIPEIKAQGQSEAFNVYRSADGERRAWECGTLKGAVSPALKDYKAPLQVIEATDDEDGSTVLILCRKHVSIPEVTL